VWDAQAAATPGYGLSQRSLSPSVDCVILASPPVSGWSEMQLAYKWSCRARFRAWSRLERARIGTPMIREPGGSCLHDDASRSFFATPSRRRASLLGLRGGSATVGHSPRTAQGPRRPSQLCGRLCAFARSQTTAGERGSWLVLGRSWVGEGLDFASVRDVISAERLDGVAYRRVEQRADQRSGCR
jgi:hypothetical protein